MAKPLASRTDNLWRLYRCDHCSAEWGGIEQYERCYLCDWPLIQIGHFEGNLPAIGLSKEELAEFLKLFKLSPDGYVALGTARKLFAYLRGKQLRIKTKYVN